MARKVVKYLLEGVGTVPTAIADGGYWPVGAELVGVTYDDTQRYVSASFVSLTKADLVSRLAGMGLKNQDGSNMTSDQQLAALNAWLAQVGMSDLA
jgi:hypothetical protein